VSVGSEGAIFIWKTPAELNIDNNYDNGV